MSEYVPRFAENGIDGKLKSSPPGFNSPSLSNQVVLLPAR
jgi:hypothetical protein